MTAADHGHPTSPNSCWCCGGTFADEDLIRLGEHPEVGLCLSCARWVKRRAVLRRHQHQASISGLLQSRLHAIRNRVIERGWHHRGRIGALLRRIDQHLP